MDRCLRQSTKLNDSCIIILSLESRECNDVIHTSDYMHIINGVFGILLCTLCNRSILWIYVYSIQVQSKCMRAHISQFSTLIRTQNITKQRLTKNIQSFIFKWDHNNGLYKAGQQSTEAHSRAFEFWMHCVKCISTLAYE